MTNNAFTHLFVAFSALGKVCYGVAISHQSTHNQQVQEKSFSIKIQSRLRGIKYNKISNMVSRLVDSIIFFNDSMCSEGNVIKYNKTN